MVPEFNLDHFREVMMWPYRIIYEIRGEACYNVAVIHRIRDLPAISASRRHRFPDRAWLLGAVSCSPDAFCSFA